MRLDIDEDTLSPFSSGRQNHFAQPERGDLLRAALAIIVCGRQPLLWFDRRSASHRSIGCPKPSPAPKLQNPPELVYHDWKNIILSNNDCCSWRSKIIDGTCVLCKVTHLITMISPTFSRNETCWLGAADRTEVTAKRIDFITS
jgi:hypothetical protein